MNNSSKKQKSPESSTISKFISTLSNSDYSKANNYLRSIIENKLRNKINNFKNNPLF